MRQKLLFYLIILLGSWHLSAQDYCVDGGPSSAFDTNLESVDLVGENDVISFTGCNGTGTGGGITGVEDVTSSQTADLVAGNTYTVDVLFGTCGGNFSSIGEVWVDFDSDAIFESGESIGDATGTAPYPMSNFTFTVPSDAVNGSTRMRIMQREGGSLPMDPCASFTYGSVTDFEIVISGGVDITCPQPFGLELVEAFAETADFTWDEVSEATDGYLWEVYASGDDPEVDAPVVTGSSSTNTANVTGLTELTDYDFYVQADCGDTDGTSVLVGPESFSTTPFCIAPNTFEFNNLESTLVDLSWSVVPNASVGYEWIVMNSGDDPETDTPVQSGTEGETTTSVSVTGLSSATDYEAYITSDCGAGGLSEISSPLAFTTPCDTFTAPFEEDFASDSTPNCWSETGNAAWDYSTSAGYAASDVDDNTVGGGTNFAWLDGSENGDGEVSSLLTPFIDVSSLSNPALQFFAFSNNTNDAAINILEVEFYDGAAWNTLLTQDSLLGEDWVRFILDLGSYTITGDVQFRFTVTGQANGGLAFYNDILLDDISVDEAPTCFPISNLDFSTVSENGADLTWDSGSDETEWEIVYGEPGFDPETEGETVVDDDGSPNFTVTTMDPATTYQVYVRSSCGNGDFGDFGSSVTFTTECVAFVAPFYENFENNGEIPNCWTMSGGEDWFFSNDPSGEYIGGGGVINNSSLSGGYFAWIDDSGSDDPSTLTSPEIDISSITNPELTFYQISDNEGNTNATLDVEVYDGAAWNNVGTYNTNTNDWEQREIGLDDLTITGNVQVRFTITGSADFYDDIAIDDIRIDEVLNCDAPENVVASNVLTNSVDLSWDDNPDATNGYIWEVYLNGVNPLANSPEFTGTVTAGTTSETISGLNSSTTYQAYLISDCDTDGQSFVSSSVTFTTECDVFVAPFYEDFESNGDNLPNCWSRAGNTDEEWVFTDPPAFSYVGSGGTLNGNSESDGGLAWVDDSTPHAIDTRLETPLIDVSSLSVPQVSFYRISDNEGNSNVDFRVEVWDGAAWNEVYFSNQNTVNEEWELIEVPLNNITITGDIKVAFIIDENNGTDFYDDVAIDDVRVDEAPTCLKPSNLTATNVGDTSFDLAWANQDDAVNGFTYYVFAAGDDPENDTPLFTDVVSAGTFSTTISGLSASTEYEIYIEADCDTAGLSDLSNPLSVTTAGCPVDDQCEYTFILTDTWGDGWNGNTMDVIQDGVTIATIGSDFGTGDEQTEIITLCDGANFELYWNSGGSFAGEVGVEVYDFALNNVYTMTPGSESADSSLFTGTVDCTPATCPSPENITLDNLTSTEVDFSWDAVTEATNGYQWSLFDSGANPDTDTAVESGTVTTENVTVDSGLVIGDEYDFYVQADCDADGLSSLGFVIPTTFEVPCQTFTAPYIEDFADNSIPACWSENGDDSWDFSTAAGYAATDVEDHTMGGGTNYAWLDGSGNGDGDVTSLLTPMVDVSTLSEPALEFFVFSNNTNDAAINILEVEFYDGANWNTVLLQDTLLGSDWAGFLVNLTQFNITGDVQARFTVTGNANGGSTFYNDILIDDIGFIEAPSCFPPSNVSESNITNNSVDLSWDAGADETQWEIIYGEPGFDPLTEGSTELDDDGTPGYTLSGLNSGTTYQIYLRSFCGADDVSTFAAPVTITTECDTFVAPFYEDFESNGDEVPNCWSRAGNTNEEWVFTDPPTFSYVGSGGTLNGNSESDGGLAWVDDSDPHAIDTRLETPFIDVSALTVPQLSFYLISDNEGNTNVDFRVEIWDGAAWNEVFFSNQNTADNAWEEIIVLFDDLTITDDIKVAFIVDENNGTDFYDDVAIDDVRVMEAPTCPKPSDVMVQNVQTNDAEVTWTPALDTQTEFDIEVVQVGNDPTGTPTYENVTDNPFVITGLEAETDYIVYVRADCGPGDESIWVESDEFTTQIEPVTVFPGEMYQDTYCYDNNEFKEWLFLSSDGSPITISFNSGTVEFNDEDNTTYDDLIIYDGANDEGTVLYDSDVDGSDLTDVELTALSGSMYITLESDIYGSCQGGQGDDQQELLDFNVYIDTEPNGFASMQIIHNSPDPAANMVDVYLYSSLLVEDLEFRHATEFVDVPADQEIVIGIAPANSESVNDVIYTMTSTLSIDENYIAVANGVLDPSQFDASVNTIDFGINVYTGARQVADNPENTDILVHHGAPDASAVNVEETEIPAGEIVSDISYTEFQGYLELDPLAYELQIQTLDGDLVGAYEALLGTLGLQGQAITVVASGFVDAPNNQNGPEFGLWVATSDGGEMLQLPEVPVSAENFSNSDFTYYPNPVNNVLNIKTSFIVDEIEVFNMIGQSVIYLKPEVENPSLDLQHIQSGAYMVKIKSNERTETFKIVKE